ncbi:MAG: mobilization protein, partial [Oscillospiraceae bacterium]|nr:mobilization protein [Oscillospiraceae bacterium]
LAADEAQYRETEAKVAPEQADALLDARASLRIGFRDQIRSKLREMFGQKFQYDRLSSAEEQIDARLGEDSHLFQERAAKLRYEREIERRRNQPNRAKRKSRDHER